MRCTFFVSSTDSVRAFKRRMKLGRFADEASEEDTLAAERSLIEKMKVGDRCQVAVQNQPDRRGTVLFLGKHNKEKERGAVFFSFFLFLFFFFSYKGI